jgi:hypothetical protein
MISKISLTWRLGRLRLENMRGQSEKNLELAAFAVRPRPTSLLLRAEDLAVAPSMDAQMPSTEQQAMTAKGVPLTGRILDGRAGRFTEGIRQSGGTFQLFGDLKGILFNNLSQSPSSASFEYHSRRMHCGQTLRLLRISPGPALYGR